MKQADKRPCPGPYAQKQNHALGKKLPKIDFMAAPGEHTSPISDKWHIKYFVDDLE